MVNSGFHGYAKFLGIRKYQISIYSSKDIFHLSSIKFPSISAEKNVLKDDWLIQVSMVTQIFFCSLTPACTSPGAYLTLYQLWSFYLPTVPKKWSDKFRVKKNNKKKKKKKNNNNNLEILCWDANTKVAQTPCLLVRLQLSVNHNINPDTHPLNFIKISYVTAVKKLSWIWLVNSGFHGYAKFIEENYI